MPSLHYEDMKDQGTSDAVALEMLQLRWSLITDKHCHHWQAFEGCGEDHGVQLVYSPDNAVQITAESCCRQW